MMKKLKWSFMVSVPLIGLMGGLFVLFGAKRQGSVSSPIFQQESQNMSQSSSSSPQELSSSPPRPEGLSADWVTLETPRGRIRFRFYEQEAPKTVARIRELVQQGFYNGLKFHRVVPGFVVQGGDPRGNGTGGSGKNLEAEFNQRPHVDGVVAMARASDPNSADSQFYISLGTHPHLDRQYTVFGQVVEGLEGVHQIQMGDVMTQVYLEKSDK